MNGHGRGCVCPGCSARRMMRNAAWLMFFCVLTMVAIVLGTVGEILGW